MGLARIAKLVEKAASAALKMIATQGVKSERTVIIAFDPELSPTVLSFLANHKFLLIVVPETVDSR